MVFRSRAGPPVLFPEAMRYHDGMAEAKLISADSHVFEPADLWVERIAKEFRDRAPRVVNDIPGMPPGSYFIQEGIPPEPLAQGMGVGKTPEELGKFIQEFTYEDARSGGSDPLERIKDMDQDGVNAEVIYTTLGFTIFWLEDPGLQRACFRVYNDWLAEYCAYSPKRLAGLALISLFNIDDAIHDLRRYANAGLKGAMVWCSPPGDRPYSSPMYDPFWAEAQELGMPISLHSVTGVGPESRFQMYDPVGLWVGLASLSHEVQRSLTTLIFSGVLERFPNLKFVSAENEAGWLPFLLQKLDQKLEEYHYVHPTPLKLKPSEYFHRQGFATFIEDPVGIANRHLIGVDNLMWSSDYPHTVSRWPHSRTIVEQELSGVPEEEKTKIMAGNAARLYGFDL